MPWNAHQMRRKGARRNPEKAARIANAILRRGGGRGRRGTCGRKRRRYDGGGPHITKEGLAIATALKRTNYPKARIRRRRR